jgi:hypothetical protein
MLMSGQRLLFPRSNHAWSTASNSWECAVSRRTPSDKALAASDTSYLPVGRLSETFTGLSGTYVYVRIGMRPRSSLYCLRRNLFGRANRSRPAALGTVWGRYTGSILRGAGGLWETGPASDLSSSSSPAPCIPTPPILASRIASSCEEVSCAPFCFTDTSSGGYSRFQWYEK